MKTRILVACSLVVGFVVVSLLAPGCGGGSDSSGGVTNVVTNVVAAPLPAEFVLDSKTVGIAAGGNASTTPAAAPTNGIVTATVTWSGGSNMVAALYKDGALQAILTDTSPMAVSGHATPGSSWYVNVGNNNAVGFTVNMVVSLVP